VTNLGPDFYYWGKEIDNRVQQESSFDIAPTPSAVTVAFSEACSLPAFD
jgi:hypothetical protein